MSDPTARSLELAREAASIAAFRMVYAFSAFGVVDLVAAIARCVVSVALPPPHPDSVGLELTSALGSAWGASCVVIVVAGCAVKLAMIVSLHRRRLVRPEPMTLWIGAAVFGIAGRVGAAMVGWGQSAWIGRAFGPATLGAWSMAVSVASLVDLLLDAAFGVTLLVITVQAVQRDQRRPDAPEGYRSPGLT